MTDNEKSLMKTRLKLGLDFEKIVHKIQDFDKKYPQIEKLLKERFLSPTPYGEDAIKQELDIDFRPAHLSDQKG